MNKTLNLGKIISDTNNNKQLVKQDCDVCWQLNTVLAVFIRDSLKIFLDKTPALPKTSNNALENIFNDVRSGKITHEEYNKLYEAISDKENVIWRSSVQRVIDSFNKYIEMCDDLYEKQIVSETQVYDFNEKRVQCGKKSLDLLKEVFDDLEW